MLRLSRTVVAAVLTLASLPVSQSLAAEHLLFPRVFAPQQGLVPEVEKPLREELVLNGQWQFQPIALPASFKQNVGQPPVLTPPQANAWDATPIRIPSPWNVNAFPYGDKGFGNGGDFRAFPSYPAAWEKASMGWLRRSFDVPAAWKGSRIILHFEAVAGAADVLVNGKAVGSNFELFLPFEVDITDAVKAGQANELLVGVRRAMLFDKNSQYGKREYVAGSMWGESIVGIWQDVYLEKRAAVHVSDTLVQPLVDKGQLQVDVTVRNDSPTSQKVNIGGDVRPWINGAGTDELSAPEPKGSLGDVALSLPKQQIELAPGESKTISLQAAVDGKLKLWSPDEPNLYSAVVDVDGGSGLIDRKSTRFGYRQYKLTANSLQLNGKDIVCKGDAWHFTGVPQMTRRYAYTWFKAIKEANGNCVRLHAQPYPRFYLDVADELGLLVLDETGIWGSGGTPRFDLPSYWENADKHLLAMVQRDRNHASVMGYSVTNEMLVLMRNRRLPLEPAYKYYTKWVNDIHSIDPTHPWISGDGEEDAGGTLPTVIGHYGGFDAPKRWASMGKPWGIGESGMAYYGTPKQVSEFNGPAAYESMAKRMEGVAIQAYQLVTQSQIPNHAAYMSVFNLAWYGLQPLPLGLKDRTKAPEIDDGVWFGPYVEGQPGMQPERLGPYCTTFNPGYDPSLPTYIKWPLFDALQAAFAPGGPKPSSWSESVKPAPAQAIPAPKTATKIALLSAGKSAETELQMIGVTATPADDDTADLLIIDGLKAPPASAKASIDRTLAAGGTVLVWRPQPAQLAAINALLPEPMELTERQSISLVVTPNEQLVSGLTNADFYFAEMKPDLVLEHGLTGPLVEHGKTLLQASNVDWRVWNGAPEMIKTAAVARSENEAKPAGAAMTVTPAGAGRVVVMNLSVLTVTPQRLKAARQLFTNLGVTLSAPRELIAGGVFSNGGVLAKALVAGRFDGQSDADLAAAKPSDLDNAGFKSPRKDMPAGKTRWKEAVADSTTLEFDFNKIGLAGSNNHAAAYISVWINSPRSLDDVLSEPDVPRVDLLVTGSEKPAAVWLNGTPLKDDGALASKLAAKQAYPAMVLKKGWNHLVFKLFRRGGDWKFGAQLQCPDADFMSNLQAAVESPN